MKKIALLAFFISAVTAGFARGGDKDPSNKDKQLIPSDLWKSRTFTAEELKKYNGKKGLPVYVAVDGIVYDLSKSKAWKTGRHMNLHDAGQNLSAAIHAKAPAAIHRDGKILEKFPKVGVLADETPVTDQKSVVEGQSLELSTQTRPAAPMLRTPSPPH